MPYLRVILLILTLASPLAAQAGSDVFMRARRMVNEGDAKAGRALVDSMLAVAAPGSPAFADALYWRGVLAEDGDSARTDLLRVAIEFSTSPRASDALLRLAQAEFTRGDRVTALRHLGQLEQEHPDAPARAMGRYWTARILFEDTKPAEACAALRDANKIAARGDVELLNQIEYYARPCGAGEVPDSMGKPVDDANKTAGGGRKEAETTTRASARGEWSVQVAAYSDRDAAAGLVKRLKGRGFDARVTPAKPWRVRVGHYATRLEAAEVAQRLSSKTSKAMVVEAEGR